MFRWLDRAIRYALIAALILFAGTRDTADWSYINWSLLIIATGTVCGLILKARAFGRAPDSD